MGALLLAVLLASLLGSLHCAGMCGAFLALALTDDAASPNPRRVFTLPAAYHGGRLITYVGLGVAAGATGSLLDLAGAFAGVQSVALPLAGLTVAGFGLITLLRHHGVSLPGRWKTVPWMKPLAAAQRRALALPPTRRAVTIGLLTTLLPCGWLYSFAAVAAGTASPGLGAAVMAVFWVGTLPLLVAGGAAVQRLTGPLGRRLPTATCLVLIGLGLWTVFGRSQLSPAGLVALVEQRAHAATAAPPEDDAPILAVPDPSAEPPCCPLSEMHDADAGDARGASP
jgi:sulfite exporter TauE/SafE